MKNVYIFYLYGSKDEINSKKYPAIEDSEIIKKDNYYHTLYAWTPNKDIRKKFKSQRDMSKFYEIKREMTKEELDMFSDEKSDTFLEERAVTSKDIDENHIFRCKNVYVLSTRKELDIISYDAQNISRDQLSYLIDVEYYIKESYFKSKYRKALHTLNLDDLMAYAYPLDDNDIPFNVVKIDTLAVYTHLYHNTYRKDL